MKYTLHENLSSYTGVVSNLNGFVNRRLDTSFDTKWTGFWTPPKKFLDYYGVKVNGIWLNSSTLEATEYGEEMVFHHETDTLQIDERVVATDGKPGFELELKIENKSDGVKAVQVAVELGVDIRSKDNDIGPEEYELEQKSGRITITANDSTLTVSSPEEFSRRGEAYTKIHRPGEKQRCYIPGDIVFRREIEGRSEDNIVLDFSTSDASFDNIETVEQELNHEFGRTFQCSIDSMENLVYDRNGKGVIAGHPWFQSYWARDSFWTLLGLIDAGYFELSKEILENFAEKELPGRIRLDGEREENDRSDTEPLFIIAADKLRRHHKISDEIEKTMETAMEELETTNGVVEHSKCGTWMDTVERHGAVDIQSLWLEAAKITGHEKEDELREGLKKFWKDERLLDNLQSNANTINPSVPLMFGHLQEEKALKQLEVINGEFSTRHGSRTKALSDPGYDASGYHTGSTWPLVTAWSAAANLEYENDQHGRNMLEKTTQFLDTDQPGALPEIVDSESGELLGCSEQAWSAGMFVHVVDTYLLGVRVKDDHVEINPASGFKAERRNKRVKGEQLDFRVEDGEVEILNEPDLDLRI